MPRVVIFLLAPLLSFASTADAASAQQDMKATAPEKMTSPEQAARMHACERDAARRNVPMNQRAKFVMDCMQSGR